MMNSQKARIFLSDTFDPWFNLATEDWIFNDMDARTQILYLWRNQNTVVIGRFQNPWRECHTAKMEQDGIKLARRQSGGGAVFHDLGNTNFTFLSGKESFDRSKNNEIITKAIGQFGIKAYASGRNDILIDDDEGPKKISGSAFKEKKDRSFHHGTLLINADLTRLGNYLSPSKKKLVGKGIQSVRSRVTNLQFHNPDLNHDSLCRAIIEEFRSFHQTDCEVELLDHEWLKSIKPLNDYYEHLKDWNWRFGETPKFTHHLFNRFDWGEIDIHLDTHKGVINQAKIFSDTLHPELVEEMARLFPGNLYNQKGMEEVTEKLSQSLPFLADEISELRQWLIEQIS